VPNGVLGPISFERELQVINGGTYFLSIFIGAEEYYANQLNVGGTWGFSTSGGARIGSSASGFYISSVPEPLSATLFVLGLTATFGLNRKRS
jgi:hypothetical protein